MKCKVNYAVIVRSIMPTSDLGCAARASQREAVYTMSASLLQVFSRVSALSFAGLRRHF